MFQKLYNYLSNPIQLAILNTTLILTSIAANSYLQVFCIPTSWAIIVLCVCFLNTILFPIFQNNVMRFISGISFCVYLYCITFLAWLNIWALPLIFAFGLGIIAYVPHFLLFQTFHKNYSQGQKKLSSPFLIGILFVITVSLSSHFFYRQAYQQMRAFKKSKYSKLEKNYFTERILGIGIIYHTNICIYDGWRPPKHDPLLVFNLWLTSFKNPLQGLPLEKRLGFYKKLFPNKPYKFNCSCAQDGSGNYHTDALWK